MPRTRATLADVARAAGVSSTAASLVLSGRAREMRISRDVEERVVRAAGELSYRRNFVSVGLRTGRTGTLGFVSDTVATSQLAGNMIKGALERARERDLMLLIAESGGDPDDERRLLAAMGDRQVDGLVLASMYTRERDDPTPGVHVPVVLLNAAAPAGSGVPTVVPDELGAGRAAARTLLAAGHRDGIHLVGVGVTAEEVPPGTVAGLERLRGITEALAEVGERPAGGMLCTAWQPPDGYEATRALLAHDRPTALLCFNDHLALGAYQALAEAGLRVPDDVSVVAFDDVPLAGWLRPALTTVALPHHALGRAAIDVLVDLVGGGSGDGGAHDGHGDGPAHVRLPMPLRVRESVAPPREHPV
ncbi:LacI family DNA-binding transcriptional regulator [Aquipuribacter sp. SD81]|uniref:LacI family DNA-binding transcriptional regulator n=1 Tax=Aquipuribacter sp. SD81 TaxID=3127703 RepID=UPI0030158911